jgi:hypothetical protein
MHKERELGLTRSAEISADTALNVTPMAVKKADSQRLYPVKPQQLEKTVAA